MKPIFLAVLIILCSGHSVEANAPDLTTAVSDVAQSVGPAVVSIKTERVIQYRPRGSYFGNPYDDDLFNQFFENFFGVPQQYERRSGGLGSGVIVDPRGYILTNDHVVNGADIITVTLPDRRKFEAELIGTDARSDLAVIKIITPEGEPVPQLPVAAIGTSDDLRIGQWVVAIGNPFGNILDDPQPTVTFGVISALHRTLPQTSRSDLDYSDLIQTDAAINPGNSGGPLVNLAGEVIGINVAIFSTSGGYQGVGFAIPINHAKMIVDQLIEGKDISFGYIGVSIQDIDPRLARYFNLNAFDGVLVNQVVAGSPAQKAGLKEGDVILAINRIRVRNSSALIKQISTTPVGREVTLEVLRDGKTIEVPVTIAERETRSAEQRPQRKEIPSGNWRGLIVNDLSNDLARQMGLANTNGVVITEIERNSSAMMSGLQKGDVIIAINKRPIRNMRDYNSAVQSASGSVLVRTVRGYFIIEP